MYFCMMYFCRVCILYVFFCMMYFCRVGHAGEAEQSEAQPGAHWNTRASIGTVESCRQSWLVFLTPQKQPASFI